MYWAVSLTCISFVVLKLYLGKAVFKKKEVLQTKGQFLIE